jgi:hypothetical protein
MCEWCGPASGERAGFGIVDRPAQTFAGRFWEGTHAQAAAGATRDLLCGMQALARQALAPQASGGGLFWAGPLVGVSWNRDVERFRYFVGFEHDGGDPGADPDAGPGLQRLSLPAMRFVADWHGEADGDVIDHYQRMLHSMETGSEKWDKSLMHHREEYPLHADFDGPPVLRLMLPVG